MAPVDVNALVEEAETLVTKRLRSAKVNVVRELDPGLPLIRASGDQIKQVLLNLLLNATEAMPKRRHALTVTTRRPDLEATSPSTRMSHRSGPYAG